MKRSEEREKGEKWRKLKKGNEDMKDRDLDQAERRERCGNANHAESVQAKPAPCVLQSLIIP